jgi:hypothetical protein
MVSPKPLASDPASSSLAKILIAEPPCDSDANFKVVIDECLGVKVGRVVGR